MTTSKIEAETGATDAENHQRGRRYQFSVNDRPYESDDPTLTGAQVKVKASIDPSDGLFLEGRRGHPDRQIADGETVDLREPGREKFYTMPAANFGATRPQGSVRG
ncbi:MAG: multiubiquitin domain-containing protein [Gemmatimonadales bacterium]